MFCGKCGKEIDNQSSFCPYCGNQIITNKPIKLDKTHKSKKRFLPIAIVFLLILIIAIMLVIKISNSKKADYSNYENVLSACCEAINKNNKSILNNLVYEKLGTAWNNDKVISTVDRFYGRTVDGEEWDNYEECLPLTTNIENYEHYKTKSELEELQEWLLDETGKIIEISEAMEIEMENESCIEIFLMKIENRWYVLYMDL